MFAFNFPSVFIINLLISLTQYIVVGKGSISHLLNIFKMYRKEIRLCEALAIAVKMALKETVKNLPLRKVSHGVQLSRISFNRRPNFVVVNTCEANFFYALQVFLGDGGENIMLLNYVRLKFRFLFESIRYKDEGVTAIEYGLIAALISVVIIVAVTNVGTEVQKTFNTWSSAVVNAIQNSGP